VDKLGPIVVLVLLAGFLWVPFTMKYADMRQHHEIRQQAKKDARIELHKQMRKSCQCWFDDSRCKASKAIVACKKPEWM